MTEQPPVLTVEGLAKVYRLPRRSSSKGVPAEIWALRDVTFQVERGVVLGIIGPNGAGKTTLLRVLSRMTPPTRGRVTGSGRVVTMLDLAAGFHPDWTGRQNVLLSGAMLGIKRGDIEARLDEIVSFAEVASFIDVPLKHYSSGMSARLIFSTALHLEPDILLADEALAVGDLGFQERCVARVREAAAGGVSVLFVSHDLEVLRRICDRILRLDGGRVVEIGSPAAVLDRYRDAIYDGLDEGWRLRFKQQRKQRSNEWAAIDSVRVSSPPDAVSGALSLQILMEVYEAEVVVSCAVELVSEGLEPVHAPQPEGILLTKPGVYSAIVRIPSGVFAAVAYTVTARATVAKGGVEQSIVKADALTFRIDESMGALPPASPDAAQPGRGDTLDLDWDLRRMKAR